MKKIFKGVRDQRNRVNEHWAKISNVFLQYLHRPDTKQDKLE